MPNPPVRQSRVYAYVADLERRRLLLHTRFDGPPPRLTDLEFSGVIAFHFERTAEASVLLDIDELPLDEVLGDYWGLFEAGQAHGWPVPSDGLSELLTDLAARGIRSYRVFSYSGLDGFVLADSVRYVPRESATHRDGGPPPAGRAATSPS